MNSLFFPPGKHFFKELAILAYIQITDYFFTQDLLLIGLTCNKNYSTNAILTQIMFNFSINI